VDIDWDAERDSLRRVLIDLLTAVAQTAARQAIADLAIDVDWALVNRSAVEWAETYSYELASGITETSRLFLQEALSEWIQSGAPLDDLETKLAPMFGPVRAEMIAVTEVTRAFAQGNIAAWRASGVVDGIRWRTAEDDIVCDICSGLAEQTDTLDGDFDGQGPPPAHVNCRCWLVPVVNV